MITWEQLQKSKTEQRSMVNSAHMLECMKVVKSKYPDVRIVKNPDQDLWMLKNGDSQLSNEYPSHYQCWHEARTIIETTYE